MSWRIWKNKRAELRTLRGLIDEIEIIIGEIEENNGTINGNSDEGEAVLQIRDAIQEASEEGAHVSVMEILTRSDLDG